MPSKQINKNRKVKKRTPEQDLSFIESIRGVADIHQARKWMQHRRIEDMECIIADQSGVPRGKIMPGHKFLAETALALPSSIFMTTVSGDYPEESDIFSYPENDGDIKLQPDFSTLSVVPWEECAKAQIICDTVDSNGEYVDYTPRNVLRRVLQQYEEFGIRPVVAPEIEFYIVEKNTDPDYPLSPPVGRSGRALGGGQGYSIAGVNEFDALIDDIYDFSEAQGLKIDTLIHEEGIGQFEINLRHGDALELADQVFMFKRTIREAALKHDVYATFMAKPIQGQPGSAMHIHQSVVDVNNGKNIFSDANGAESKNLHYYIGGMQRHTPAALLMLAPYVNSYRRLVPGTSAPINVSWGYDNRTSAFRVPLAKADARRVENRIPSSDANPYLAMAASLACGLIGLREKIEPISPAQRGAGDQKRSLPNGLIDAVEMFLKDEKLHDILGKHFVNTYASIKLQEFKTFMDVISPWEREYLLLNV